MTSIDDVRATVRDTIIDVLDLDADTVINEATTADDIKAWDSLHHVRIMLALERKFGFQWDDDEVTALQNVGDLYQAITRKIGA